MGFSRFFACLTFGYPLQCMEFSFKLIFFTFFHYRFSQPARFYERKILLLMFVILKAPFYFPFVLHHSRFFSFFSCFITNGMIFQVVGVFLFFSFSVAPEKFVFFLGGKPGGMCCSLFLRDKKGTRTPSLYLTSPGNENRKKKLILFYY